jgi:hypothetical protein
MKKIFAAIIATSFLAGSALGCPEHDKTQTVEKDKDEAKPADTAKAKATEKKAAEKPAAKPAAKKTEKTAAR